MSSSLHFYAAKESHGELSNFFVLDSPMLFMGKTYATSEHLYQALKYLPPDATQQQKDYANLIRLANTPNMAKVLARRKVGGGYAWRLALNVPIAKAIADGVKARADWDTVKLQKMEMILLMKFQQNEVCRKVLLSTRPCTLVEHTARDSFWGDGGDGTGANHLGRLLEIVRENIARRESKRLEVKKRKARDEPSALTSLLKKAGNAANKSI